MFATILEGDSAMRALLTGLAILALATSAAAAPRAKAKKPPATLEISNQRAVALSGLEILSAGEKPKTVTKLGKPLAAGAKTRLKLTGAKGCDYIARWNFEDAGDEGQVNLCNDPKIVLTD